MCAWPSMGRGWHLLLLPAERESSAPVRVSRGEVAACPLLQGHKRWVSPPRGKGMRLSIAEERDKRLAAKQSSG